MPSRRQSLTREELKAERMTGRINRRIRVMAVFTSRAGELLDSGAVAAVTACPSPAAVHNSGRDPPRGARVLLPPLPPRRHSY
jgi:hypothetical protein